VLGRCLKPCDLVGRLGCGLRLRWARLSKSADWYQATIWPIGTHQNQTSTSYLNLQTN
jgi:hypothetical protein